MVWLFAEPEPRFTAVAAGPAPVFEAGIPARPRWPRFTAAVAGRFDGAIGLFAWPSATGAGCALLFTTAAGWAWANETTFGAGGAITCFGGAGGTIGTGWFIFTSGS